MSADKSFVWTVAFKVPAKDVKRFAVFEAGDVEAACEAFSPHTMAVVVNAPNAGELATALGFEPRTQRHHAKTAQISARSPNTGHVWQAMDEAYKLLGQLEDPANKRAADVRQKLLIAMGQIAGRQ